MFKSSVFAPGQLLRRIRNHGEGALVTNFIARLALGTEDDKILGAYGEKLFGGRVEISYDCVGLCLKQIESEHHNLTLVLFGEFMVVQNTDRLVPYEV